MTGVPMEEEEEGGKRSIGRRSGVKGKHDSWMDGKPTGRDDDGSFCGNEKNPFVLCVERRSRCDVLEKCERHRHGFSFDTTVRFTVSFGFFFASGILLTP
jgi:hypothetical protein